MKSFADPAKPVKQIIPTSKQFPSAPEQGEIFFYDCFGQIGASGLYIYVNDAWVALYSVENNVWERHTAKPRQQIFKLRQTYRTDGKSVVVYIDGVRQSPLTYAEAAADCITFKFDPEGEDALKGGELIEFQFFNLRKNTSFDPKEWSRRK